MSDYTVGHMKLLTNLENKLEADQAELLGVESKLWAHNLSRWARWRLERRMIRLKRRIAFYERSMDHVREKLADD